MRTTKAFAVLLFLILMNCNPRITHVPQEVDVFVCDFTKYQKQGFTFTPYQPNGNYESMGFIDLTLWPELNYKVPEHYVKKKRKVKTDTRDKKRWIPEPIRISDALDLVYKKAVSMGANTVCETRIVSVDTLILKYPKDGRKKGYRITGWAINQ